jgi:hypothetical protein
MNWLRLYHSVLDDPKVQRLSAADFKFWINALICASQNTPRGVLPDIDHLAFRLHSSREAVEKRLKTSQEVGLIHFENGFYRIHNWDARQFSSDDINQRVTRHRGKKRNVTGNVTRNGSETPSDTDTDTDTEYIQIDAISTSGRGPDRRSISPIPKSPKPPSRISPGSPQTAEEWAERLYARHPKKKNRVLAEQTIVDLWCSAHDPERLFEQIDKAHSQRCGTHDWQKNNGNFAPSLAEWLNDRAYEPATPVASYSSEPEYPRLV